MVADIYMNMQVILVTFAIKHATYYKKQNLKFCFFLDSFLFILKK